MASDIKFYYKFDTLLLIPADNRGNVVNYIYTGSVFSDKQCKNEIGEMFVEQLVFGRTPIAGYNSATNINRTVNLYTVKLAEGDVTFKIITETAGGKILRQPTQNNKIGPFLAGTNKYLRETAKDFVANVLILADNNTREVTLKRTSPQ